MQYSKALTVTAGTTAATAVRTRIRVARLVLSHMRIYFPAGCNGLVRISLWQGGKQFAPSTHGEWFRGNDGAIDVDEYFELWHGSRTITIKGWNEDSQYNHTILVDLTILPEWAINPRQLGVAFVNSVKSFIRKLAGR